MSDSFYHITESTLSKTTDFSQFQTIEFADNNLKFYENVRKFSYRVQTLSQFGAKGEIAH